MDEREQRQRAVNIDEPEMKRADEISFDMEDLPEEIKNYGEPLKRALTFFQNTFGAAFAQNDSRAKLQQSRYRLIVRVFSISGTAAIVLSILHLTRLLSFQEHPKLLNTLPLGLFFGEALAVLFAGVTVAVGLVLAFQSRWLERRHKAELLRLVKFSSIIDPGMLSGNDQEFENWKERLIAKVQYIDRINHAAVHEWIEEARIPAQAVRPLPNTIDDKTTRDLLDYYRKKRLDPQIRYLYQQARSNLRWDWSTRLVPPLLFVSSVFFAVLHLISEAIEFSELGRAQYLENWKAHQVEPISVGFIILAAILPVVGAGWRGVRSAYEFSRNTLRYNATHFALELLRERLQSETRPEVILRDLWWCEWMLEAEHREWLRLMVEAEWFG